MLILFFRIVGIISPYLCDLCSLMNDLSCKQGRIRVGSLLMLLVPGVLFAQDTQPSADRHKDKMSSNPVAVKFLKEAQDSFLTGNFRSSAQLSRNAITADTNFIAAYDNAGLAYRNLHLLDSAEYFYLKSFEKNPSNSIAAQNLAVASEFKKDYSRAMLLYTILTQMEPENPEGHFGLARTYYLLGRKHEALESAHTAENLYLKQKSPYIADCYIILTVLYFDLGYKKEARLYLKQAKQAGAKPDAELERAVMKK